MTCRKEPRIKWFFDSLHLQCGGDYTDIRVVVVDYHAETPGRRQMISSLAHCPIVHVPPKPTVWQGANRLTNRDYFAASNARNTALCHAQDGWISYVDDLSVLALGWLDSVRAAISGNYIVYGTYQKVLGLIVDSGLVVGFREHPAGFDPRRRWGNSSSTVNASGSWLYGCSLAAPVEAFLAINGWDEDCDGLGSEDSITGIILGYHNFTFRYDLRMLTIESEEDHYLDQPLVRLDKGQSPNDKSHAILKLAMTGRRLAPNYFGPGGIRAVRARVLAGEPFPSAQIPEHDWFDGQPLREL